MKCCASVFKDRRTARNLAARGTNDTTPVTVKTKEMSSSPKPPEESQPCQHCEFWTVKPVLDSDFLNCERVTVC